MEHDAIVGKGLAGALEFLRIRRMLKKTVDWSGRSTEKKKSKLVGIFDEEESEEEDGIRIDRTNEYGRTLTPKEAFRRLSHAFHGKKPGLTKRNKRMRRYHKDLTVKKMSLNEMPLNSVGRMWDAQEKLQTPFLVLSGHYVI
ncbi:hypothetical protein ACP275_14G175400 [Erythranthe tilingii]